MRFGCYSGTFYCSVLPNSKYSSILRRRKRNPSFSERGSQRFFAENSSFLGPIARFSYLSTTAAIEKEKAAAPLLLPTQSPLRSNQESHQYCRTFSWLLTSLLLCDFQTLCCKLPYICIAKFLMSWMRDYVFLRLTSSDVVLHKRCFDSSSKKQKKSY